MEQKNAIDILNQSNQIINKTWKCLKKISAGSFGTVLQVENLKTQALMAAKIEQNNNEDEILSVLREANLLIKLQGIDGIPKVYWSGTQDNFDIMIIQLLGKDLGSYLRILKKFSVKTICEIGIQCIKIIQKFHEKNIIHRDLKPENILMGKNEQNNKVYIIDFGISKYFRNNKGVHISFKNKKSFIGTTRYAPIAAHKGYELCCKDDLESLAYVLIYLGKGKLPWQNLNVSEKDKQQVVGESKIQTSLEKLCKGLPNQFVSFLQYLRNLNFAEEVNYQYLLNLLYEVANQNNFEIDRVLDWNKKKDISGQIEIGSQYNMPNQSFNQLELSALSGFKINESNRVLQGSILDLDQIQKEDYNYELFEEFLLDVNLQQKMEQINQNSITLDFLTND